MHQEFDENPISRPPADENQNTQPSGPMPPLYAEPETPPPTGRKKAISGRTLAVALCFSLLGSALGAGSVLVAGAILDRQKPEQVQQDASGISAGLIGSRENTRLETAVVDTGKLMTAAQVYAANVHSTVGITTSVTTNFWGFPTTTAASGSGFILTEDGYIITNHHVIEGSDSIRVSMYDGSVYDARLIGSDESNDLAVLKIDAKELSPVIIGDSDNLNVGDNVIAIGNPLGELTFTLTAGAVSAKDRSVTFSNAVTMNLIQTDCAINSGNSGGALFNLYGEVIGITNAKYSSSSSGASIDNIGFAIPINSVMGIIESIMEKGYVSKPFVGIAVTTVSKDTQQFGIPAGAAVQSVAEGSPAEAAGLQIGDIITHLDGQAIQNSSELVSQVGKAKIGDVLALTVYRKGETLSVHLTVGEQIRPATQ